MANLASEVVSRVDSAAHDLKGKAQATENYLEKMSHDAGKRIGVVTGSLLTMIARRH